MKMFHVSYVREKRGSNFGGGPHNVNGPLNPN